jgi:hypothetical protein
VKQTPYDSEPFPVQADSRFYYSLEYVYSCVYTDVCVRVLDSNTNGCKLVWEEVHYHMVLVQQQCGRLYCNCKLHVF